jgi:hypothetical protein
MWRMWRWHASRQAAPRSEQCGAACACGCAVVHAAKYTRPTVQQPTKSRSFVRAAPCLPQRKKHACPGFSVTSRLPLQSGMNCAADERCVSNAHGHPHGNAQACNLCARAIARTQLVAEALLVGARELRHHLLVLVEEESRHALHAEALHQRSSRPVGVAHNANEHSLAEVRAGKLLVGRLEHLARAAPGAADASAQ